jgi:hypothetical protein
MSDGPVPERLQSLWQDQPVARVTMSLDELRQRARYLERRVDRRNLREYIASVIMLFMFGAIAWKVPLPMVRASAGLTLAATAFIVYHLSRHGTARTMPADLGLTGCVQFHRRELERQRDLLRGAWKWYLLPFMPGLILMYLGPVLAHPEHPWRAFWPFAGTIVFFVFVGELNRRAAIKIQAAIDMLERNS